MSKLISVTCRTCGHQWYEDSEKAQKVIYKGEKKTRVKTYAFTCPKCGDQVAVEVEREA